MRQSISFLLKIHGKRLFTILLFFFNDTATTEIYTLSLHDALPISASRSARTAHGKTTRSTTHASIRSSATRRSMWTRLDRKSTRLNSSHSQISYAVFCLKKKKESRRPDCAAQKSPPAYQPLGALHL